MLSLFTHLYPFTSIVRIQRQCKSIQMFFKVFISVWIDEKIYRTPSICMFILLPPCWVIHHLSHKTTTVMVCAQCMMSWCWCWSKMQDAGWGNISVTLILWSELLLMMILNARYDFLYGCSGLEVWWYSNLTPHIW